MNKLILPKTDNEGIPYLSYSQISTWKKSKREYIRQYFFGEKFEGNAYTDFGSKVGEALENNDFSGFTTKEKKFLKTIPRYDQFEREIKLQMDGFYVKGFIDTNSLHKECMTGSGTTAIYQEYVEQLADYKTGDVVKKKADYESKDYNQLEIYAAAIEQELGELPNDVKVFLIGRSGNAFKGEKLKLTNEFITITRNITPEIINKVKKEVQKVAIEISKTYEIFLKLK